MEFDSEKFKKYWRETEVIREYQSILFTFGNMELPYVFAAEHIEYAEYQNHNPFIAKSKQQS